MPQSKDIVFGRSNKIPSKIEWDLTNRPLSKLRSSYEILRFRGSFSGSCWRFLGKIIPGDLEKSCWTQFGGFMVVVYQVKGY